MVFVGDISGWYFWLERYIDDLLEGAAQPFMFIDGLHGSGKSSQIYRPSNLVSSRGAIGSEFDGIIKVVRILFLAIILAALT